MADFDDLPIEPDTPPPAAPQPRRPRRVRRFSLPDHHHDEKAAALTDTTIEAFVTGLADARDASRGATPEEAHPATKPQGPDGSHGANGANGATRSSRPRRPFAMDTRPDWMAAVQHEAARHARYGRPASVLLAELLGPVRGPALDRIAREVVELIQGEARETDRAVRFGPGTFRMLMPETGGRAARAVAERLERAFEPADEPRDDGMILRIEVATASRHGSLEDALADAVTRVERRVGPH